MVSSQLLAHHTFNYSDNVFNLRQGSLFQVGRVWHGHLRPGDPLRWSVKVIEALLVDGRYDFRRHAALGPPFFNGNHPVRFADRLHNRFSI